MIEVKSEPTKDLHFKKKCNIAKLHKELVAAGFDICGVSLDGDTTIVHLKTWEEKDPTSIVEAHVCEEEKVELKPPTPKINIEKLIQKLIEKGIIKDRKELE